MSMSMSMNNMPEQNKQMFLTYREEREFLNEQIKNISSQIFDMDFPVLDIGKRGGYTGYIDFIEPSEFNEAVNKGTDNFGRKFISFRANIHYDDGKVKSTFTTLFQRYMTDEELWMGAGSQPHLFSTDGGTTPSQFKLLLKLLLEKSVDVTQDIINECRLYPHSFSCNPVGHFPTKITLFEQLDSNSNFGVKSFENIEDVMGDLECKVNPKSLKEGLEMLDNAIQTILSSVQIGSNEFQERVGRQMTYAEMRSMWG